MQPFKASSKTPLSRRNFLLAGAIALTGASVSRLGAEPAPAVNPGSSGRRIYKTLKIGMVKIPGSLSEQFNALREIGFDGIEMDSPGMDVEETRKAIADSGLVVDGTVCSSHWRIRHSDPDVEVRANALRDLQQAIRDTRAVGGHSVLLVAGHGRDGTEQEVWERSVQNIREALPLAAELGVFIAIENVWNHFLYDHNGPDNQSAEKLRDYVDAFNSPWVGVHFDIGNHQKYGPPAEWIHTLGKRIVKLDVKDWSKASGWSPIGEGDVDWGEVREALEEIGYTGWAAAEVTGGDRPELEIISRQMDKALGL